MSGKNFGIYRVRGRSGSNDADQQGCEYRAGEREPDIAYGGGKGENVRRGRDAVWFVGVECVKHFLIMCGWNTQAGS